MSDIGNRLRAVREKNNFTRGEFAKLLKIAQNTLSNYEKSNRNISLEIISFLVSHFEINASWLITGIGSMYIGEEKKTEQKTEPATSPDSSDELFEIKVENAVLKKDNDRLKNENKNLIEENKDLIEERGRLRERVTIAERNNSRNNNTQKGASAG